MTVKQVETTAAHDRAMQALTDAGIEVTSTMTSPYVREVTIHVGRGDYDRAKAVLACTGEKPTAMCDTTLHRYATKVDGNVAVTLTAIFRRDVIAA